MKFSETKRPDHKNGFYFLQHPVMEAAAPHLKGERYKIWLYMANKFLFYTEHNKKTVYSHYAPAQATIAQATGNSRKTVGNTLTWLTDNGWLTAISTKEGCSTRFYVETGYDLRGYFPELEGKVLHQSVQDALAGKVIS